MTSPPHIAVIGAGMAGLSCATALQQAGFRVSIFDKSRGPAGRMSTRRGDGWQCDHGAQYFTARDTGFRAEVARWEQAGAAAQWFPALRRFDADGSSAVADPAERFVGTPRMTAPAALLASTLALRSGAAISELQRASTGWRLHAQDIGAFGDVYDAVVLAVPAPQAGPLLRAVAPRQAALADETSMQGCWAMMLQYAAPLALGFEAAFVNRGPLRWVARDSAKPGRDGTESWLLHASAAWSEAHMALDADGVAAQLLPAFAELGGPAPQHWNVHRWRYASTATSRTEACSWDAGLGVGMCGDWLNGGTVEAAWLSGRALAQRIAQGPA
ncbi:NAD(P)/FAD-dependent oxidoreductase [Massilia soli]|uniref:FAD-dependent oxidoreductase n=1 Tax=Massilia soli TaxID=2792854 RepID=A0ABS7SKK0_9BURK|nr:FAD-dependent oxidoreductase [Massilia soli]MBZ2205695.1 FAD-dependent oxidoreductase [Massilia soli]